MRLLPKSELNQAKNLEKKLEIDQGLALARRIDKLREKSAKEELNDLKYRVESGKILKEEINELIIRRDSLREQVHSLEKQLIELELKK